MTALAPPLPPAAGEGEPPLLEVRAVTKTFGGIRALAGVDLAIGAGELRCIIGPNGCGKTTLFNVVTGAFGPSSGAVFCRGRDITGLPAYRIARLGIGRKFQVPGVYPTLSVVENIEIPLLARVSRRSAFRLLRPPANAARLGELLDRFGLAAHGRKASGELSHGLKQWLEIAMLMASDADLILLDEPTAGMSAAETAATAELIQEIRRTRRVAVLVIEHDMTFVRELACPVVVMLRGTIHCEGTYEQVQADPTVREAYLGPADARGTAPC